MGLVGDYFLLTFFCPWKWFEAKAGSSGGKKMGKNHIPDGFVSSTITVAMIRSGRFGRLFSLPKNVIKADRTQWNVSFNRPTCFAENVLEALLLSWQKREGKKKAIFLLKKVIIHYTFQSIVFRKWCNSSREDFLNYGDHFSIMETKLLTAKLKRIGWLFPRKQERKGLGVF